MIFFSQFARALLEAQPALPNAVFTSIRTEALDRLRERQRSGRGDTPLDFTDLAARIEDALAPKR